jgi:Flp pilus assembly protein TadD
MSDFAFELRWDDHVILEHDGQSREEREQLYVGDDGFAQLMVDGLAESGLCAGWTTHLELDQNEGGFLRTPIDSVAAGRARSTAYRGSFALASNEAELQMFLAGAADVSVQVRMPARDRLVERLLRLANHVRARVPEKVMLSPVLAITTRPVPRVRPRRVLAYWPSDALVMLVDGAQLDRCIAEGVPGGKKTTPGVRRYQAAFAAELKRLREAALPVGAARTEQDGYLVFDFTGAGETPGAAAAAFESWIIELGLDLDRHANDNEHGDPMVSWSASVTRAPEGSGVTLYDRFGYTAYLADVREGESITRPEKLRALQAVKRAGKLPTGEKVKLIMLIVPVREEAIALYPMVQRGEVDAVVYKGRYLEDPNVLGESRWLPFVGADEQIQTVMSAFNRCDYAETLRLCGEVRAKYAETGETLTAYCLGELGRYSESEPLYRKILDRDPNPNPMYWSSLAYFLVGAGRDDEARRHYSHALELLGPLLETAIADGDEDAADLWSRKAYALLGLGRPAEAKKAVNKALALDGDHFFATQNLGRASIALGDLATAETAIARARELRPDSPYPRFYEARILAARGRTAPAKEALAVAAAKSAHLANLARRDPLLSPLV